jgi:E1A/CREB-binding protein
MKTLWEHIAHCKNQQCNVQHCMSSRYVLSHYRRCKDARCPACGPVRETIRKSQEKDRGRQPQGSSSFGGDDIRQNGTLDGLSIGQDNQLSGPMNLDALSPTPESYHQDHAADTFQNELQSDSFEPDQQPESFQPDLQPESFQTLDSYQPEPKRVKTEHRQSISSNGSATIPSQNLSSAATIPMQQPNEKPSSITILSDEPQIASVEKIAAKEAQGRSSEDHSLLNSFTIADLETHVAALNRTVQLPPAKLKMRCMEVLKGLQTHQHGWVFNTPVDPVELGLPDYFEIIKKPMDLGTIHRKIDNGSFHSIQDFQVDVNLTFDNAMTYNEEGSVVHDMAKELKAKFEVDYAKLVELLDSEDRERRQNERACTLCGCEKLLFEPPVFFCSGVNCQSSRIRRNSHFYVGGNNQYYWCNTCYNELDGNVPIEFGDITVAKADLKKKKNDEVHEESWVQCDSCERWIHQICGLFNTRQNKEHHSEYCCPKCLLAKRKPLGDTFVSPPRPLGAVDLPRTKLSEFLEEHIEKRIGAKKRRLAEECAETEVRNPILVVVGVA